MWKLLVCLLLGDPQVLDYQLLYSKVCIFEDKIIIIFFFISNLFNVDK